MHSKVTCINQRKKGILVKPLVTGPNMPFYSTEILVIKFTKTNMLSNGKTSKTLVIALKDVIPKKTHTQTNLVQQLLYSNSKLHIINYIRTLSLIALDSAALASYMHLTARIEHMDLSPSAGRCATT